MVDFNTVVQAWVECEAQRQATAVELILVEAVILQRYDMLDRLTVAVMPMVHPGVCSMLVPL